LVGNIHGRTCVCIYNATTKPSASGFYKQIGINKITCPRTQIRVCICTHTHSLSRIHTNKQTTNQPNTKATIIGGVCNKSYSSYKLFNHQHVCQQKQAISSSYHPPHSVEERHDRYTLHGLSPLPQLRAGNQDHTRCWSRCRLLAYGRRDAETIGRK